MALRFLIIFLWVAALLSSWLTTAAAQKEHLITGRTMGTTYNIKVVVPGIEKSARLQAHIDERLEQINQSMSTYRADSEISRFNALQAAHTDFAVSDDFLQVLLVGKQIFRLSLGAWDCTINPLVNLWGFGKDGSIDHVPAPEAIAAARQKIGFDTIEVSPKGYLKKSRSDVTIDLASIAKGYGVDQVAFLLKGMGFKNYLVEIGGEVYAAGRRLDGQPWRVGINRPRKGGAATAVYKVVALEDRAMATSGDYRLFVEIDGRTFSHIIDPRSGYPVANGVVSVSVIAPNCTLADGLATGLMVMGSEKGLGLLNRLEGVEGLIIVRLPDGSLKNHWSKGLGLGNK